MGNDIIEREEAAIVTKLDKGSVNDRRRSNDRGRNRGRYVARVPQLVQQRRNTKDGRVKCICGLSTGQKTTML